MDSLASTTRPDFGNSTKTTSPRACWAWSVMPMVRCRRIRCGPTRGIRCNGVLVACCSWWGVLFEWLKVGKSDGGQIRAWPLRTKEALTTRALRRLPRMSTSTLSPGATPSGRRPSRWPFEGRREGAAGGFAFAWAVNTVLVGAQHALVFEHQAEHLAAGGLGGGRPCRRSRGRRRRNRRSRRGRRRGAMSRPCRCRRGHAGLEAQGVAGAEAAGFDAGIRGRSRWRRPGRRAG